MSKGSEKKPEAGLKNFKIPEPKSKPNPELKNSNIVKLKSKHHVIKGWSWVRSWEFNSGTGVGTGKYLLSQQPRSKLV